MMMAASNSPEKGPDRILPTEDLFTWAPDGCVKIRKAKDWPANRDCSSLPTLVKKQCESGGDATALAVKREGEWKKWSYSQYYDEIVSTAKAFVALGLEPHNSVCIYGFNAPEWFFSNIGAIYAGGKAAGLYPTNSPETNKFIINDCNCNILVVDGEKSLERMWTFRNEFASLKKIVMYEEVPDKAKFPDVLSWSELTELGKKQGENELQERLDNMAINQCCTLIYTSGTTGNPKGVMLSHDNVFWTGMVAADTIQMREGREVIVSYLPLSHVAGTMLDIWAPMMTKSTVYFADKMALKGTLLDTLREVRPTIFLGVPRVWEKIMEGMRSKGASTKGLKKKIADICKKAGIERHLNGNTTVAYTVGQKLVYKKVKEALGFDRCVSFFTGAAPISMEALKYFLSLDIVILELYGMSECTGPQTLSYYNMVKHGSVGKVFPGAKNRFADPDEKGEGEICMWGRHVMMGYLNREDKTKEDADEEGWIHSGDLGTMDSEGFVYITGRKKELIITAGGENVAPIPIEDNIKAALPCISNAVLIGDRQKFLSVFLTFKVEMDQDEPTNKLTPAVLEWCEKLGRSNIATVDDILQRPDPVIMAAIQAGIDKANKKAISNAAKVQRWTILPTDMSIPGGELGPTLKLKRFYLAKKYEDAIQKLYSTI